MASKPFYEEGLHVAKVVSQGITKASTGNFQFFLRVKVLGMADPGDDQNYIPHRTQYERTIYRAITDKTVEYLVQDLEVLGFEGESFSELDPSHPQHQSFVGKQFDVTCTHEDDTKGGVREKWSVARGMFGSKPIEPLQARELRQLDSLFGKALKTRKKPAVSAPAQPGDANESLQITDDDIPF